jgi:nanoRNase/pAp phosphatase (c-di-AMP/oligoRNAs hydrolase)
MPITETLDQLKDHLSNAQSTLVLLASDPSYDQLAASLALTAALQAAGKEVTIATPLELSTNNHSLVQSELVQQKLGNQNLSIKFPYQAEAVDKVSYHISDDNHTFYLVIKPQKGFKPLDVNQVTFDYTGANADLIFLVGVHQFEALEHLYFGYEEVFEQATIVSIHTFETAIGTLKIDTSKYAAYSQAMVFILQYLQLPVSADGATNLLAGIEYATEHFSTSTTTADTFEAVAQLMRQGARRLRPFKPSSNLSSPAILTANSSPAQANDFMAALKNTRAANAHNTSGGDSLVESTVTSNNQKKKKSKKGSEPGALNYQPGAEGSMGRG